jgi:regulator of Ty1 transposition protein 103
MSAYNEEILAERLHRLSDTQESIQTLSHWITFHKRHAWSSVKMWYHEFQQGKASMLRMILNMESQSLN